MTFFALAVAVVLDLVVSFFAAIPGAWVFMLALGMLHGELSSSIPAVGYGAAFAVFLAVYWSCLVVKIGFAFSNGIGELVSS